MHESTIQVEQNENASMFQGRELGHIVHVEETRKELDEDIFTSIIEEFFLSLDGNYPKSEVGEQHDEARRAAIFSLQSHEENHSTRHEVVVEESVDKGIIGKKILEFVLSRGCPIRHLAWLEDNKMSKVTLELEHEDTYEHGIKHAFVVEQEQSRFIDPFWSSRASVGDFLPAALEEAMRAASLHVAIFSPTYAQSPWCLAELSFILKTGKPIIPVFYGVQPTDLRWVDQGMYAQAFSKHQEKGRYSEQKIKEWSKALRKVSYYKGEVINNNDVEQEKLKNIVNRVLKEIEVVPLIVAKHPMGLEEAVIDFEKTVRESGMPQIVGIWGMGGSGKTTLAKELYNQKRSYVDGSSFVFDIRDAASKKELHKKQKYLLKDLGVKNIPPFDNIEKGKEILSNRLGNSRVLIILDDVDHIDQLDALLPIKDNLALGSLIIVTTRERDVLTYWNISSIYKMKTMKYFYAKQLFCWHAFLQPFPKLGFEKLVEKFTSACNGLPLSLKVLGGQLYYYSNKDLWEDLLLKISKILPEDIKNRLRVSYDSLDEEEKQIFLDVACFFIGEDHKKTIAIWEGSGWSGLHSWERLVNKCFVDLDSNNQIRMHGHFRDLGREIANTQLPCRLWSRDQITGIQTQEEEKVQIRGMILNAANNGVQEFPGFLLNTRRLSLPEFKIFVVKGNYGDNLPIAEFSTNLAWLSCTGTADRNLPLKMENLRVLELYKSRQLVGLWKDVLEAPMQLRVLIVSDCPKLGRIPKSIECLKKLKQMSLCGCKNVKGLPEEFCRLELLEHLQLKHCEKLSSLPSCFGELINLRHLDLSYSYKLRRLPDSFKKMKLLQHLNLSWCKRLVLQPDILEKMTKLEYLNFSNCFKLRNLPGHITKQPALRELYSEKTYLRELPMDIGQLSNLRVLKIGSHFKIQALPESMGNLNHLEHLALDSLKAQSLPISFTRLINLQTLEISSAQSENWIVSRGNLPRCPR
ncbi:disease resistance protein RPV1-like [Cryptomeria japonica]|uniref:disease resistance protein RPV1-like n=1 Tax=Cryptomeria japonica TaxID=3369 RepID=UPI0027DA612A|nr:disease resistance protein RPV1-like [Cryptomeria japonica]